jgi:cell fate (sporulation/competence/biofilm development) regulator YlbF (YheA/YmcA/DUF963 family)
LDSQQDISNQIDLLAKNEEAVAALYQSYVNRFPEHEEFWSGMVMAEIDHSNLIREIAQKIKSKKARIYEHKSGSKYIEDFNNIVKQATDRAKHGPLSHTDALSTALQVMKYITEHSYFDIFDSDSEEIRTVLDELATANKDHYTFIKEHLK